PLIVGGATNSRGVVAAANYAARKFGIRSAMPVTQALARCKHLTCLPVNMPLYVNVSRQIHEIFYRYTPEIEPLSLDEAFLNVAASQKLFGSARDIALQIKKDIENELGLIASAGVGPNKFIAKIASDIGKPNGFVVVQENEVQSFLDPLPVNRIWGVGNKTEQKLHQYGIFTIRDVREQSLTWLTNRFAKLGHHIYQLANGIDDRKVITDAKAKSISAEKTFNEDISERDSILAVLSVLTEQVAARLREKRKYAKTVIVKIRFNDFDTITRSKSLSIHTNHTDNIWLFVKNIISKILNNKFKPVRLLGVGVSGLENDDMEQGDLFSQTIRHSKLDAVTDKINTKFGKLKVHRGRNAIK
ncbi:MAG: DNA polymerase IV, partial [Gammaproteobacteria bacterium]|nr:DNA polymerase IV [Gammaproteobacteria bacterium]